MTPLFIRSTAEVRWSYYSTEQVEPDVFHTTMTNTVWKLHPSDAKINGQTDYTIHLPNLSVWTFVFVFSYNTIKQLIEVERCFLKTDFQAALLNQGSKENIYLNWLPFSKLVWEHTMVQIELIEWSIDRVLTIYRVLLKNLFLTHFYYQFMKSWWLMSKHTN